MSVVLKGMKVRVTFEGEVMKVDHSTLGGPFVHVRIAHRPSPDGPVQRARIWVRAGTVEVVE